VTVAASGTVDVPHHMTARTLSVYGDLQAERYNNLVTSFKSTNPFVPPSAAALGLAYRTLSNMIVSVSNTGGIGPVGPVGPIEPVQITELSNGYDYSQPAEFEVSSISTGTLHVAETGFVDATRYLNLALDWKLTAAQDLPASAYALHGAYSELSNAISGVLNTSANVEWRSRTTGDLLATIDANTGVFTAAGGYSNLPIAPGWGVWHWVAFGVSTATPTSCTTYPPQPRATCPRRQLG
jgi:hypothetical protein